MAYTAKDVEKLQQQLGLTTTTKKTNTTTAKTNTTTKTTTNTNTGSNNVLAKKSSTTASGNYTAADVAKIQQQLGLTGTNRTTGSTNSTANQPKSSGSSTQKWTTGTADTPSVSRSARASSPGGGAKEDAADAADLSALSAYSAALDSYRENKNSGDPMGDYVTTKAAATPSNLEKYETYNDWLEADERNGELVRAIDQADKTAARQLAASGKPTETVQAAADKALQEQGYSRGEIATARNMAAAYEGMGLYDAGHRVANTAGGVVDTIASAIPLAAETGAQAAKNMAARAGLSADSDKASLLATIGTNDNYFGALSTAFEQAYQNGGAVDLNTMEQLAAQTVNGGKYDERLLDAVERINGSGGLYTYEDLAANSEWDIEEIEAAAAAIAGTKKAVSHDGLGYGLYKRGQELTADAQKGLTSGQKFVQGAATSAAENLVVGAINPAAVLPVLSAQGAAESMGQAAESGQEAGTALASGLAKFGLGWMINSVGVTNLAETMGSDYAAGSVAADINSWMRSADGLAELAEKAPTIYAMISGGADNAVQAFAETYADAMVDAVIGGQDVSFDSDMFLQAMEAAASGGVSGAMGGGVGAQIGRARANRAAAVTENATTESAPTESASVAEGALPQSDAARQTAPSEMEPNRMQPAAADLDAAAVAENATAETATEPARAESASEAATTPSVQRDALATSLTEGGTDVQPAAALFESGRLDGTAWDALRADRRTEARLLAENTQMSGAAIDVAMDAMPDSISGEVYSAAANSMYQLARQGIANNYEDALALASKAGVMTGQVLATDGGEDALRSIFNQGKIEGLEASGYAAPTLSERAGEVTFEEGTRERLGEADTALIDLAAKASDTAITVKNHLENDVGGYADTAIGEVFFGVDDMADAFATLLHEQNHQFNAWDGEGGRLLQTELLRALAEKDGFESVDRLAQSYIERYAKAGQEITYAEACEEITGDALRGIFGTEESFDRWVNSQVKTYDAGYESKPKILKIFEAVGSLLDKVAKSARQILHLDKSENDVKPELRDAAKRALALSEERRAQLEELYYSHARRATANERAAYGETEQGQLEKAQKAKEDAEAGDDWGWGDDDLEDTEVTLPQSDAARQTAPSEMEPTGNAADAAVLKEYPQAKWSGEKDASYKALTALPDMEITRIADSVEEGRKYSDIMADAFENMGAGRDATSAVVRNKYTGMDIEIRKSGGLKHGMHGWRQIAARGAYTQQIGSIMENAVKVNELDARTDDPKYHGEDHNDIYLGFAENESGELVGVRLNVAVYNDGAQLTDAEEIGKLYSHAGGKIKTTLSTAESSEESGLKASARGRDGYTVSSTHQGYTATVEAARPGTSYETGVPTASIAELLEAVKGSKNISLEGVLSEDVKKALGSTAAQPKEFENRLRYQLMEGESEEKAAIRYQLDVDEDDMTNRRRAAAWYDANRNEIENALEQAFKDVKGNKITAEKADKLAAKLMREVTGTEKDHIKHRSKEDKAAQREQIAKKLVALGEYMSGEGANYDAAIAAAESIAEDLMHDSQYIDRTLWDNYPDFHEFNFSFAKNSGNYKELLYAYDSWSNARKELARYNIRIKLDPEGTKESFDTSYPEMTELAPGFFPEENATEHAVEIIDMAKHMIESIRPTYRNQFEEDWDGARADIALRILGEMTAAGAADGKMAQAATERINANLNALREGSKQQMLDALAEQERVAKQLAKSKEQLQKTKEQQARADERLKRTKADAATAAENDPRLQAARLQAREADVKRAERGIKSRQAAADVKIQKAMARADAKIAREEQAVRVQKTRNEISRNLTKLNHMLLHPKENAHVPQGLLPAAVQIAELANFSKYNKGMVDQLTALKDQIKGAAKDSDIYTDWKDGQIDEMLNELTETMRGKVADRTNPTEGMADIMDRIDDAALDFTSDEAKALFAKTGTKEGRMIRMTPRELEVLSNAVSAILKATENANKLVGQEYKESADMFADMAVREVESSAAKLDAKGKAGVLKQLGNMYQNNALNAERYFRRLGGYREGGAMDRLGQSLAAAENRKIYIQQKGEEIFKDVTGKDNRKQMQAFAGRKAELVDVGLVDRRTGETVKINHAQLVSLYQHLRYEANRDHVLNGGISVPDMDLMARGKTDEAQRKNHLAMFQLSDAEAITRVTDAMTDYDYKWVTALDELHNHYTKDTINEVSRKLHGFERATVDGYYPINVDKGTVEMEIQGLKTDQRLENRGFLKERKHGQNPVNLLECNQVAETSLKNAAEYGGMAAAIRDANKILNMGARDSNSLYEAIRKSYGSGAVKYVTKYLTDLQAKSYEDESILTAALNKARSGYAGAVLTLNPSVALAQAASLPTAGAVLGGGSTMKAAGQLVKNLTSKGNKESERIRQEMMEHGNGLLEYRMRGNLDGEMASMDRNPTAMDKVPRAFTGWISRMDEVTVEALWEGAKDYVRNHPNEFAEGAKTEGSEEWWAAVSAKQTEIINKTQPNYTVSQQAAIQRGSELSRMLMMFKTQSMQNYGILSDAVGNYRAQAEYLRQGEADAEATLKGLKETAAVNTQRTRSGAVDPDSITHGEAVQKNLEKLRANRDKASKELRRAVVSQVAQGAVFVGMKMLVSDLLFMRLDREQDENGDITAMETAKRFGQLYAETFAGIFLGGSEALTGIENFISGGTTDSISVTGLDALNDVVSDCNKALRTTLDEDNRAALREGAAALRDELDSVGDWSKLPDLEKKKAWGQLEAAMDQVGGSGSVLGQWATAAGDAFMLLGIPLENAVKLIQAGTKWAGTAYRMSQGESFGSLVTGTGTTATQYGRMYTAIFESDEVNAEEVAAARQKLAEYDAKNPPSKDDNAKAGDSKILSEMISRIKKYDADTREATGVGGLISQAAEARVNGDEATRKEKAEELVNLLCAAIDLDPDSKVKEDVKRKRTVIDRVNSAIQSQVNTMLGRDSDTGATEYDALISAIDAGKGAAAEQQKLRTAGKDDGTIKSALTNEYKETYCTADEADRARLAKSLTALTDSGGEAYYTQEVLDGWVTDYVLQGDNESVWTDLDESLENGGETGAQAVLYYIGQGKSASTIKNHITNEYKKRYKAAGEAERLEIQAMLEALRDDSGKRLYKTSTIKDWAKE